MYHKPLFNLWPLYLSFNYLNHKLSFKMIENIVTLLPVIILTVYIGYNSNNVRYADDTRLIGKNAAVNVGYCSSSVQKKLFP